MDRFPKLSQFPSAAALRQRLASLGVDIPLDDRLLSAEDGSPLAAPLPLGNRVAGNRWCIHPMEGWDAHPDGSPSEHTLRRWRRFGQSGAKLIWGGEAAAVQPDGRANPRQTMAIAENESGLRRLREALELSHREAIGSSDDLIVGLQLTHSGRFCRPNSSQLQPRIPCHHPPLDAKFGIDADDDSVLWTDDGLEQLIDNYVAAAATAAAAGYHFVDVKACHGYLLHEFLGARRRPGKFGGDFAGRTRLLTTILGRIRDEVSAIDVAVRLSVFDMPPFQQGQQAGEPMPHSLPYDWGFGVRVDNPLEPDLTEPFQLLRRLEELGVIAVNVSCGSPYYNPHIQRPAYYPPSDGYRPPEDPLLGVARQIDAARQCKQRFPSLPMVGSGYSYLQEHLPQVGQALVRQGWIDAIGLGRMVLSYPEMPQDSLSGAAPRRKQICRTFSDCTTAPRHGLLSGCYPLDDYYKNMPEAAQVKRLKRRG